MKKNRAIYLLKKIIPAPKNETGKIFANSKSIKSELYSDSKNKLDVVNRNEVYENIRHIINMIHERKKKKEQK